MADRIAEQALIPRAEDTLDAFPEETSSERRVSTARQESAAGGPKNESLLLFDAEGVHALAHPDAQPHSLADEDSLLLFEPAGPPAEVDQRTRRVSSRRKGSPRPPSRRSPFAGLRRALRFAARHLLGRSRVLLLLLLGGSRVLLLASRQAMQKGVLWLEAVAAAMATLGVRGSRLRRAEVVRLRRWLSSVAALVVRGSRELTGASQRRVREHVRPFLAASAGFVADGLSRLSNALVAAVHHTQRFAWRGALSGTHQLLGASRRGMREALPPLLAAATALVPHRLAGSHAMAPGLTVTVAISAGLIFLWEPTLPPLRTTLTPSWVPLATSIVASSREPLLVAAEGRDQSSRDAAPPGRLPDDRMAIQRTLNKYRDGFSILDIATVKAVWPSADEGALRASFDALYDQSVEFDGCRISVSAATATALCRGNVSYIRNQRGRQRHSEPKEWHFTLRNEDNRWIITTAVEGA